MGYMLGTILHNVSTGSMPRQLPSNFRASPTLEVPGHPRTGRRGTDGYRVRYATNLTLLTPTRP